MGIRFECVHCGHTLHVKDYLAGKRGICPHCQAKIDIPSSSTQAATADEPGPVAVELQGVFEDQPTRELRSDDAAQNPSTGAFDFAVSPVAAATPASSAAVSNVTQPGDPIGEAPQAQWYVLPPGSMTKYGPAPGETMRLWLTEGRIAADSLVWREGWPQWRGAASVFPQLAAASVAIAAQPTAVVPREQEVATAAPTVAENTVVLGLDEPVTRPERANVRKPSMRRLRDQRSLIMALLAVLVLIFLPLLVYVLLNQ